MTATTSTNRFLLQVDLAPVQGSRFAPTGFADLGAAIFKRPVGESGWVDCLLVESAQSMANRLEATMWDAGTSQPDDAVADLPYLRIHDADGKYLTSSREESHRLASPYVRNAVVDGSDKTGTALIVETLQLSETAPHDYHRLARAVFSLDPIALVHGVFFAGKGGAEFPGQPKFTRLLTGFIEAIDVQRADSGGVKRDRVNHTQSSSGGDATDGYGSIPFSRTEWTARTITASFNLDLAQLRSYGLPEPASRLLETIAKLEIATLLSQPLRLRTNCDLQLIDDDAAALVGSVDALAADVRRLAKECRDAGLFGEVVNLTWRPGKAPKA